MLVAAVRMPIRKRPLPMGTMKTPVVAVAEMVAPEAPAAMRGRPI
jgi:hypothetical protein